MHIELTTAFRRVPEGDIRFVEGLLGANSQGATLDEASDRLREAVTMGSGDQSSPGGRRIEGRRCHPRAVAASGVRRVAMIRHIERHGGRLLREEAVCTRYPNPYNRKLGICTANKAGGSGCDWPGSPLAARLT